MGKVNLSSLVKATQSVLKKHSPEILTGIGIAGMITTTIMAVRATPKALCLIDEGSWDEKTSEWITPTKLEKVKLAWICYIPAAVTGCASIACLIGASSVNARRNAALATAYALSESALKEYQEKVIETIGDKKEQSVRDAIAKDKIDRDPVSQREVYITSKGDTLCYDVLSGRYFKSDIDRIKKAENELNKNMLRETYISLNDFYYEIGISNTPVGDDLGWNANDGLVDLRFSSQLSDEGTPCLVIDYLVAPRYDYQNR